MIVKVPKAVQEEIQAEQARAYADVERLVRTHGVCLVLRAMMAASKGRTEFQRTVVEALSQAHQTVSDAARRAMR